VSNPVPLNKPVESLQSVMPAQIAEPEKPKAPIPEQHIHLKTILDELKNQCYENAKNPVNTQFLNIYVTISIYYYICLHSL